MESLADHEESFNTERLESQNSADNLRQSMQRYLATKHQHLKMASEKLLAKPSENHLRGKMEENEMPKIQQPPTSQGEFLPLESHF